MTIDELRAFCLALPESHEQETWGDAEHAGDVTFRVRGKIYVITGQGGGSATIRTDRARQTDLLAAFPDAISVAPYVGRFGWISVRLDALDPAIICEIDPVGLAADGADTGRGRLRRGGVEMTPPTTIGDSRPGGQVETIGARRIAAAFGRARARDRVALIPYVVAGYPDADTSFRAAIACVDAGADLLEVGLPYSDPLADGATLQRASAAAIEGGATLARSLELLARIAAARPDVPLVPMGYADQILGGGDGTSRARALAAAGASGVIVADLTPDEGGPFEAVAGDAGIAVVYLVAPTTPADRRQAIANRSGGFLYCVSLVGVTGARASLPASVGRLIRDAKRVATIPVAVGFGVSRPSHVRAIARAGGDGVIVASALVDAMGLDGRDIAGLRALVGRLRSATAA